MIPADVSLDLPGPIMNDEHRELIDLIRSGDQDAFARYLGIRTPQLLGFIEKKMGTTLRRKIEAEDILQEVGMDCVKALNAVDLTDRDPFSWMCQMAERRIIDAHRHHVQAQKRSAEREVALQAGGGNEDGGNFADLLVRSMTTPSQAFSRDQKEFRLLRAVQSLPEDQREAIRLRYIEKQGSKEIAEQLGKSDGAVRVLLTRTLKKLQDALSDDTWFRGDI